MSGRPIDDVLVVGGGIIGLAIAREAARDLYPAFAREVADESGLDPALLDPGTLVVATGGGEAETLDRQCAFQRSIGLSAERVRGGELRRLEPSLSEDWVEGLYLPRDRSVDNVLLVQGLERAA